MEIFPDELFPDKVAYLCLGSIKDVLIERFKPLNTYKEKCF